ncbi:unnamed protein product [Triticum turgidum subsp. durum]|nr:unnamed protein product [Triticum turgidum subsp. durum]
MPLHLLLLLLLLPSAAVAGKARQSSSFALDFFPGDGAIAQLALTGANATSAGDISMRSPRARPLNPTGLSLTTPLPHRLPRAPPGNRYPWVSLLLAAACGAVFTFVVLFVWYSMGKRRPVAPVEYPMHPSSSDIVYEKIVLVGVKDLPADVTAAAHK